ncbi:MAG: hydroxymethylbilane synthase [Duodenibacillus sp.]|nr:hydroxymethylbilane synthase [Duodenibacillus sp.]
MPHLEHCIIATRESPLAMWQALHVQALLRAQYPGARIDILGMTTRGDQILDKTLSKVGGKGLFVKELEAAMLAGEAHIAVHSLKDVPMELPEGFTLAAVSSREDPRDAFVSPRYESLEAMPAGSRVGTASLRRELMLRARFPGLEVRSIRGNVGTRLAKLDRGEYDALVMAGAGLKRLEMPGRIRGFIDASASLPAPGQGALGIECLASDAALVEALQFLNDPVTRACTAAERAVSRALGGSCQVPLAAYAVADGEDGLWLRAHVGDHRTGRMIAAEARGPMAGPEALAARVVEALRAQGAEAMLACVLGQTAA